MVYFELAKYVMLSCFRRRRRPKGPLVWFARARGLRSGLGVNRFQRDPFRKHLFDVFVAVAVVGVFQRGGAPSPMPCRERGGEQR